MSFVERYLRSPHLISAILILGVALGFLSFKRMPLNLFPDVNYPKIAVIIVWPGASAQDVEDKIARPVEKEIATIDLIRKVRSVSRDQVAAITAEFEYKKGLDSAEVDVSAALNRVIASLPKGILPPRIFRISDATAPVCTLAVYPKKGSFFDLEKVRQIADNELKEALLNIPEVADVEVFGGYFPELRIIVDRNKLYRYGLSFADIENAVYSQNLNIPAGMIIKNKDQILIKVSGEKLEKRKLEDLVIGKDSSGEIHLRDVAKIKTAYAERQSFFHGDGIPAIGINILRAEKGHVTTTLKSLHKHIPEIKRLFPQLEIRIVDSLERIIQTSVSNMIDSLRDAILLTVSVMFMLLANIRITSIAAVSIPFTYFLTFFGMRLFGFELNMVTLTAVILSVGLLLDDAIVVIENIDRHLHLGKLPSEAAVDGTKEIWLADFAGTATTVVVLIPIMFIGGYVQRVLRQLTVVLSIALISSYLISITVIPLLAQKVLRPKETYSKIENGLLRFSNLILDPLRNLFVQLFKLAYSRKALFIALAIAFMVVSIKQMGLVGKDLMPPMDTGIVKISFETEPNSSISYTEEIVNRMEKIIKQTPGLIHMATVVGSEPGVISFGAEKTPQQGVITAHFVDRFHRKKDIWQIEDELREKLQQIPGLRYVHVYEFGATPLSSIAAPIDIMISGPNPELLNRLADEVMKKIYKVKGLKSVSKSWDISKKELHIKLDLEKITRYGINPVQIASYITGAFSGKQISILRVPGEDGYVIRPRFIKFQRENLKDLFNLNIKTPKGEVPLKEIANFSIVKTRTNFTRERLSPVIDVLAYRGTAAITHIQAQVNKLLKKIPLPPGYKITQEGEIKQMKESFLRLKKSLILAIILLYFSMVPTFKSFLHPVTIMISIPFAIIGAIWALIIVGRHFCMPASMGMILLSGIVVNNSILVIDFIKKAMDKGSDRFRAVEEAIKIRVRPIIMTALGTITGMLPIAAERALGLERLSPLAVVAIGGLIVSTLLTLIYVPLFFCLIEELKDKIKKIKG
jgi:multidrug efflux pump subunit AcrB